MSMNKAQSIYEAAELNISHRLAVNAAMDEPVAILSGERFRGGAWLAAHRVSRSQMPCPR